MSNIIATPFICESEREFLALKGDGTESVKLTVDFDRPNDLNGWYLFLKENDFNTFIKQSLTNLPLIDRILCETKYFQFDRNAGLLPNSFHHRYSPLGAVNDGQTVAYYSMKAKLETANMWKPIREIRTWEFVK